LYDIFMFVQDTLVSELIVPEQFPRDDEGRVFEFPNTKEFQSVFEKSQEAFKRVFDSQEHHCGICSRNLLGDKFFFLSGCIHFFCLECIQSQVIHKILEGNVGNILCPESGCGKHLNDWDIRNMQLSDSDKERYDSLSLKNAIAQMDDVGWCPVPNCGSIANIDREDNTGTC